MEKKILLDDEMLDQGYAFSVCAELCRQITAREKLVLFMSPVTVNYAFACEVFLKLLQKRFGSGISKGHELNKLFGALPPRVQEDIQAEVLRRCGQWSDLWGGLLLDQISDAFVSWRYSYEHDMSKRCTMQINITFLAAFCETLREICCKSVFGIPWDAYKRSRQ